MSTSAAHQPIPKPDRIDPITTSVIQGALENIAVEMGYKLMRMSYSSIIRESEDFGAALVDAEGRGLAESAQSTPLQSGPIPGYVRGVLRILKERGDQFRPGDVVMHNDAYSGASHGPDVAFIVPVFVQGKLIAFAATTAHHLDIGALSPGSCGIVEAIDAYAEGLQFKAIKVYDRGVRNDMVWQIVRDNIRASDLVVGDMDAQVGGRDRCQCAAVVHPGGASPLEQPDVVEQGGKAHAASWARAMWWASPPPWARNRPGSIGRSSRTRGAKSI